MTAYTTNQHGIRFYIETAMDFADDGRVIEGRGVFAGLVQGNDELGGVWFADEHSARAAIAEYRG
tara:strand:+ start:13585 stop:13779 length:195 start_codon:yes stop_codon:yes gene_type:complete